MERSVFSVSWSLYVSLVVIFVRLTSSSELMFELPDNEKMCFHEVIEKGVKCTLEFQVITGGNYDVDLELTAPGNRILYKETKKQYDTYTWTADVGNEDPLNKSFGNHVTVLTQMETSANVVHENMKTVIDYQTHHRLREAQGETFAEGLNSWVLQWSVGQTAMILLVGIGQVMVLRSFFTDKMRHSDFHHPKIPLST